MAAQEILPLLSLSYLTTSFYLFPKNKPENKIFDRRGEGGNRNQMVRNSFGLVVVVSNGFVVVAWLHF